MSEGCHSYHSWTTTGRVLSIGAGIEQVPSIIEARRRGFHVTAFDGDPAAAGLAEADEGVVVDISDERAVIERARVIAPDFVVPVPIGRFLITVGAVNDALGLRGISRAAAVACADKARFHEIMKAHGFYRPRQEVLQTADRARCAAAIAAFGQPCILKSRQGSGKKGVIVVERPETIDDALAEHLITGVPNSDLLVEELVEGEEFGVDAVVVEGQLTLTLVREKVFTPLPYCQEIEYHAPALLTEEERSVIAEAITRCAVVLGLDNCFINADVRLRSNGTVAIIEIAGRPGGLLITNRIIPAVTGMNVMGKFLETLSGHSHSFAAAPCCSISLVFLHRPVGVTQAVPDAAEVASMKGVLAFESGIKVGDVLKPVVVSADVLRRGYILTRGATIEESRHRAMAVMDRFVVEA
jgi:biotin carboxylase